MGFPQSNQDDAFGAPASGGGDSGRPGLQPDWLTNADPGSVEEGAWDRGREAPRERARSVSEPPPRSDATPQPAAPVRWGPAASSIPTLRVRNAEPATPADPAPEPIDFEPNARSAYLEVEADPLRGDADVPVRALAPLKESWWMVAVDALCHDLRVQIVLGALVVAITTFVLWPRSSPTVSLAVIRQHPQEYDGRDVTVHGRVGDVFRMGGGYTFYLEQGRESMVVFTRSRVPVWRQDLTVKGTISTGYLDGLPRPTLFESTP